MKRFFIGIILLFGYFVIFNSDAKAWYSNDYDYRLPIELDNTLNSENLSNHQIKIVLDEEQTDFWSRIKSDGSDIRFVDSNDSTSLDFWLKSFDYEENLATIWVEVPELLAESIKNIYLYFGNSEAQSASSFDQTMELEPVNFFVKNYDSENGHDQAKSVKFLSTNDLVVAGNYANETGGYDWLLEKYSEDGESIWSETFDFDNGEVKDLAIDSFDNIIAIGYSEALGDKDWYIRKYDSDGNILWSKTYDSGGNDEANAVIVDNDDNVIAGGYRTSGTKNWYLRKYDADGNIITDQDYDSALGDDILYDLAVDSENNIIATGNRATDESLEFYTIKYTNNLVEDWNTSYEKGTANYFRAVEVDSNNNIYLGGYYNETDNNWLLRKVDSEGNLVWDRLFDSELGNDYLYGLAINSLNQVILVGDSKVASGNDLSLRKYDSNGNLLYSLLENESNNETYFGIDFNENDDFALVGFSTGTSDSDWLVKTFGERKYTEIEPEASVGLFSKIAVKTFDNYIRFNDDSLGTKYVSSRTGIGIKFLDLPDNPTKMWMQIDKVKKKPNFLKNEKSLKYFWKLRTNLYKKTAGKYRVKIYFPYKSKKIKKAGIKEKNLVLYSKQESYVNYWKKKDKTILKKNKNLLVSDIRLFSKMKNWFVIAEK
ncbi:MAG: DUF2341 domain-containing protein [Patescibacteria group bacterium]|nr:DUF2341 domain-containing protein [Patescibacteria group bacterium]